jgi:hypothetical protein
MPPPDRLTIPASIGCGAMRKDQTCPGPCAERRVELVSAGDYDRLGLPALQQSARSALRRFSPPAGHPDDLFPPGPARARQALSPAGSGC